MAAHSNIAQLRPSERKEGAAFEVAVREHLECILQSPHFDASARSRDFLRFVVDEALAGRGQRLNQSAIAMTVFGRTADFDAILDPIVRVQAGRLRRSLERYYLLAGTDDCLHIELTKGSYAPAFITQRYPRDLPPKPVECATAAGTDWPTLIVHPFEVRDSREEHTAARIADELTTELHRYDQVRVVRQCDLDRLELRFHSRFELRGSVCRESERCLIGARLVDRTTAEQVWSDEYRVSVSCTSWPCSVDDVARLIAARVGAEHGVIMRTLSREYRARHSETRGSHHAIVRCQDFLHSCQPSELLPTIDAVQEAAMREPHLSAASQCLARLYLLNHSFELSDLQTLERAIAYADHGASLDPASARMRCTLAATLLVKGELQAARNELDLALQLNGDALAHREIIGWLTALAGDWERGEAIMRDASQRNPYCLPLIQHGLWAAHLRHNQLEAAYGATLKYQDSGWYWRALMKASSLGLLGRVHEAQAHVIELLQAKPQFRERGRALIGYYIKTPELLERIVDGLRNAGLVLND